MLGCFLPTRSIGTGPGGGFHERKDRGGDGWGPGDRVRGGGPVSPGRDARGGPGHPGRGGGAPHRGRAQDRRPRSPHPDRRLLLPAGRWWGGVVSVASDGGRVGGRGEGISSAAKGGVIAFTKAVAREVARHEIRVNCVCPGPTDTPLLAENFRGEAGAESMGAPQGGSA